MPYRKRASSKYANVLAANAMPAGQRRFRLGPARLTKPELPVQRNHYYVVEETGGFVPTPQRAEELYEGDLIAHLVGGTFMFHMPERDPRWPKNDVVNQAKLHRVQWPSGFTSGFNVADVREIPESQFMTMERQMEKKSGGHLHRMLGAEAVEHISDTDSAPLAR